MFYKIAKIVAGQSNSGLITETGDLLLQGMNDQGQLGIGSEELSKALFFFGDFMKKDFFYTRGLKVLDVSFGTHHTLVLCEDKATKKNRVFGCGSSELGQLCKISKIVSFEFTELTNKFPQEILSISAGSLHSLFLTKDRRLYGCGRNSKGQLGSITSAKTLGEPIQIKIPDSNKLEIVSMSGGSLYSMALCREK